MSFPEPGKPVRGSKSGAPIMALFDLLGRSWAMGIVWNLGNGPMNFRQLQVKCETLSPTTLNTRLKELRRGNIIQRCLEGYELTTDGHMLLELLKPLGEWAHKWSAQFSK